MLEHNVYNVWTKSSLLEFFSLYSIYNLKHMDNEIKKKKIKKQPAGFGYKMFLQPVFVITKIYFVSFEHFQFSKESEYFFLCCVAQCSLLCLCKDNHTSRGMCPWYQPWLLMSAALSFSSSSSSLRSFSGGDSSRYFSLENWARQTRQDNAESVGMKLGNKLIKCSVCSPFAWK